MIEPVWNSIDADAHHVDVTLRRSETDVDVADYGHLIAPEDIATEFTWAGTTATSSPAGLLSESEVGGQSIAHSDQDQLPVP